MGVLYALLAYVALHRLLDNMMRWYARGMAERTNRSCIANVSTTLPSASR